MCTVCRKTSGDGCKDTVFTANHDVHNAKLVDPLQPSWLASCSSHRQTCLLQTYPVPRPTLRILRWPLAPRCGASKINLHVSRDWLLPPRHLSHNHRVAPTLPGSCIRSTRRGGLHKLRCVIILSTVRSKKRVGSFCLVLVGTRLPFDKKHRMLHQRTTPSLSLKGDRQSPASLLYSANQHGLRTDTRPAWPTHCGQPIRH